MKRSKPNLVLITLDTWRHDALGCAPSHRDIERYGMRELVRTPNLNRVAGESVYFTQAVSCAPHTTVSHASLMTGLFPAQHGVRSFYYERLAPDVETLAEALRAGGYATITLRETEQRSSPGILQINDILRGFDTWTYDLKEFAATARRALDNGKPVFAFLHLWDLHAPYLYALRARVTGGLSRLRAKVEDLCDRWRMEPPASFAEGDLVQFAERVSAAIPDVDERIRTLFRWYLEGVEWFDREQWPVVEDALRRAGLWDDAVCFLYGDHGERCTYLGDGRNAVGHGASLRDEALRVPLLVRGLAAPRRVDAQVSLTDVAPTAAELAGMDLSRHFALWRTAPDNGQSLLAWLGERGGASSRLHFAELRRGLRPSRAGALSPQVSYLQCVRSQRHKLLRHEGGLSLRHAAVHKNGRRAGWRHLPRLARFISPRPVVWFWIDLAADPDEASPKPVFFSAPEEIARLRTAHARLYREEREGPVIDLSGQDEAAVEARLRDLGYIE